MTHPLHHFFGVHQNLRETKDRMSLGKHNKHQTQQVKNNISFKSVKLECQTNPLTSANIHSSARNTTGKKSTHPQTQTHEH